MHCNDIVCTYNNNKDVFSELSKICSTGPIIHTWYAQTEALAAEIVNI